MTQHNPISRKSMTRFRLNVDQSQATFSPPHEKHDEAYVAYCNYRVQTVLLTNSSVKRLSLRCDTAAYATRIRSTLRPTSVLAWLREAQERGQENGRRHEQPSPVAHLPSLYISRSRYVLPYLWQGVQLSFRLHY